MNILLILIGISGSGKTTFAKILETKKYHRSSYDSFAPNKNKYYDDIEQNIKKQNVVCDNLNLNIKEINYLIDIGKANKSRIVFKIFNPNIELSLNNLNKRYKNNGFEIDLDVKAKELIKQENQFNILIKILNKM